MKNNDESIINSEFPDGVAYEIFIQSWADGNGDGIGDFIGAIQKLDYLQDLGVSAVWLMPIMPSPSYHKYDVTDYKAIHPDYGTMDDFKTFLKEAHNRNIKVIIDMIINHTSSEHPWFKEAVKGRNNPYRDYYIWADIDTVADKISKKEVTQDSDNITQWHAVNNDRNEQHYYGFFWGGMPDLNFDNPKVRKEIYDIGKYWLNEIGVDGFRLDAAKHIFPDERIKDSYLFWQEYKREMQKVKDDVYLVGEVWAPASVGKEFAKGLPALFNFDLAGSIQQSVIQEKNVASTISGPVWKNIESENLVSRLIKQRKVYKDANSVYKDAIFLSNHDQNRIMTSLNNKLDKAKLAASILLTLAGTPYIYYGEEIGMLGKKPDPNIREPFLWDTKELDTFRTNWIEAVFTKDGKVQSLREQKDNPLSLYHHYRNLIHFRNQYIALSKGNIESIENSNPYLVVYRRVYQNEVLNVVHNLSSQSQLLDTIPKEIIYGGNSIINNTINPFSTIIYK